MQAMAELASRIMAHRVPALIQAPLVHYYELIHPFWDGNGRVGRVLEAALLQGRVSVCACLARYYYGYRQPSPVIWKFQLCPLPWRGITWRISTSISRCSIAVAAMALGRDASHTPFVQFHLEGCASASIAYMTG